MPTVDPSSTIGRRAAQGGIWLLVGEGASRLAGLGGLLLLASLLAPEEFGIVAVAAFVSNGAGTVFGLGLGSVLQSMDESSHLDKTSLFLALFLGSVSAAAVFLTAPITSVALGSPEAAEYIRALAPGLLLARWSETRSAMIERELSFKPVAVVNVISSILSVSVAVAAALIGAGAWALVLQSLTMYLIAALGMTALRGGERWPRLTVPDLRPVWSRLRPVLGNSVFVFAYGNLDDAVVAKLAGTISLGYYNFAYRISSVPAYMFTHMVNRVMLPTYKALKDEGRSWALPYRRMVRVLAFVCGLIVFGICVYGPTVLTSVYGSRWESGYVALRVLSIYGLCRTIGATTGPVFLASGNPSLIRRIAQWQTIAMLTGLLPAVMLFDITGAALAVTVPLVVATFIALRSACRIVGVVPRTLTVDVLRLWCVALGVNVCALPIVFGIPGPLGLGIGGLVVVSLGALFAWFGLRSEIMVLRNHFTHRTLQ